MNKIEELESMRSDIGTTYISCIFPGTVNVSDIVSMIKKEIGTTKNVKDRNVAKSVETSLKQIKGQIEQYKTLPENGICLYAGDQCCF
jgi:peptide subunit release factor 1 (eRF1)